MNRLEFGVVLEGIFNASARNPAVDRQEWVKYGQKDEFNCVRIGVLMDFGPE